MATNQSQHSDEFDENIELENLDTMSDSEIVEDDVITEKTDNLVPITDDIDPTKNPLYNKIEQLIDSIKTRNDSVDEHFDAIDPAITKLLEETADLNMQTSSLENAQRELTEHTANLASASDSLRTENDRRAAALEEWNSKLQENADTTAEHIIRIDGKTAELDQMDYQLSEEVDAERSRIDQLLPRTDILEDTTEELQQETAELQKKTDGLQAETAVLHEETGTIRHLFKTAVWSASAVALVLAIATGSLYWFQNNNALSIDKMLADMGIQQERILAVEEMTAVIYDQLKEVPAKIETIYQELSNKDVELAGEITAVNTEVTKANDEIAVIKSQIFIADENLSSGAYNIASVKNDAWLLEQSAKHYTIQIVGVYGENALSNFIGRYRNHLDLNSISYLHTTHKGRNWYTLLQGSYATAAAAEAAKEAMSVSLQRNSPYVRKFARIQERVQFRTANQQASN